MLFIFLVLSVLSLNIAQSSDTNSTVELKDLPEEQKEEVFLNVARRIFDEVTERNHNKLPSTEIPPEELKKHDAYVDKIMKEETAGVILRKNDDDTVDKIGSDAPKDSFQDLTLRAKDNSDKKLIRHERDLSSQNNDKDRVKRIPVRVIYDKVNKTRHKIRRFGKKIRKRLKISTLKDSHDSHSGNGTGEAFYINVTKAHVSTIEPSTDENSTITSEALKDISENKTNILSTVPENSNTETSTSIDTSITSITEDDTNAVSEVTEAQSETKDTVTDSPPTLRKGRRAIDLLPEDIPKGPVTKETEILSIENTTTDVRLISVQPLKTAETLTEKVITNTSTDKIVTETSSLEVSDNQTDIETSKSNTATENNSTVSESNNNNTGTNKRLNTTNVQRVILKNNDQNIAVDENTSQKSNGPNVENVTLKTDIQTIGVSEVTLKESNDSGTETQLTLPDTKSTEAPLLKSVNTEIKSSIMNGHDTSNSKLNTNDTANKEDPVTTSRDTKIKTTVFIGKTNNTTVTNNKIPSKTKILTERLTTTEINSIVNVSKTDEIPPKPILRKLNEEVKTFEVFEVNPNKPFLPMSSHDDPDDIVHEIKLRATKKRTTITNTEVRYDDSENNAPVYNYEPKNAFYNAETRVGILTTASPKREIKKPFNDAANGENVGRVKLLYNSVNENVFDKFSFPQYQHFTNDNNLDLDYYFGRMPGQSKMNRNNEKKLIRLKRLLSKTNKKRKNPKKKQKLFRLISDYNKPDKAIINQMLYKIKTTTPQTETNDPTDNTTDAPFEKDMEDEPNENVDLQFDEDIERKKQYLIENNIISIIPYYKGNHKKYNRGNVLYKKIAPIIKDAAEYESYEDSPTEKASKYMLRARPDVVPRITSAAKDYLQSKNYFGFSSKYLPNYKSVFKKDIRVNTSEEENVLVEKYSIYFPQSSSSSSEEDALDNDPTHVKLRTSIRTDEGNDMNIDSYVEVIKDMINTGHDGLANLDWLATTVDIRGALRKAVILAENELNGEENHPLDKELLLFMRHVTETAFRADADVNDEAEKSVKKRKESDQWFEKVVKALSSSIDTLKRSLKKNPKRTQNRKQKEMSNLKDILVDFRSRIQEKQILKNERRRWLKFLNFYSEISEALEDLHAAVRAVALISNYRSKDWFQNLLDLYLRPLDRHKILQVLLHLLMTRTVDMFEQSAHQLEGDHEIFVNTVQQDDLPLEELKLIGSFLHTM